MNYTANDYPSDKVKSAIKDGLTDAEIIKIIFGSDWSYIHFVENIRKAHGSSGEGGFQGGIQTDGLSGFRG